MLRAADTLKAAEGLRVHYEVYGEGEPIVVLAGALMPIKTEV
jgi:hypothetical protein